MYFKVYHTFLVNLFLYSTLMNKEGDFSFDNAFFGSNPPLLARLACPSEIYLTLEALAKGVNEGGMIFELLDG